MPFGLADTDIVRMQEIFASRPQISEVLIFGSRAMDTYKPGSDIDLAIVADSLNFNDMLDLSAALDQIGLLYKIDLLDLKKITDSAVLEHIRQAGRVFYHKE